MSQHGESDAGVLAALGVVCCCCNQRTRPGAPRIGKPLMQLLMTGRCLARVAADFIASQTREIPIKAGVFERFGHGRCRELLEAAAQFARCRHRLGQQPGDGRVARIRRQLGQCLIEYLGFVATVASVARRKKHQSRQCFSQVVRRDSARWQCTQVAHKPIQLSRQILLQNQSFRSGQY